MATIGLLCVLFYLAAVAVLLSRGEATRPLRETALIAAVVWAVWLVVGTELLSLAGAVRWWPVLAWWLIPAAGLVIVAARDRRWLERLRSERASLARPDWLTWGFLLALGVILLVTLVVAAITPPNNWDSMVYHLPRQVHWLQRGSVAHYATGEVREIMMPPMAEFAGLHFMILTQGDAWANLVSWFALAMTALAVSLLARELGAGARGQSLAALLVVANPMAAMQAVNPKNDLVVSLWACAMAYFVLTVWTRRRCGPGRAALIGAALGLMVLTKGTGYIVGLPISLAAAAAILGVQRWRGLATGAAIGAIALAISGGHFARNVQVFGAPLGPPGSHGQELSNDIHTPAAVASNVVRNLAIHAATPWEDVNQSMESLISRLHSAMGIGVSDPRTSYNTMQFGVVRRHLHEDAAGAPVHLVLALIVLPLLARRRWRLVLVASLVPVGAFVLFCMLLKWQAWHARLHLPIVCLFMPIAATLLGGGGIWRGAIAGATAATALVVLAPSVLWGQQKPLLGDPSIFTATWEENVFRTRPATIAPFRDVIEACRDLEPSSIAIVRRDPEWTYPFQRALLRELPEAPRFVAVGSYPSLRDDLEAPDVVLHTDGRALWIAALGARYVPAAHAGQYTVYVPQEVAARRGLSAAPPPFIGWQTSRGLARLEGPNPHHDLPQVRWGLGPATTLVFHSDGEAATLILEGRRNNSRDQFLVVRLNEEEVARHEFGRKFDFQELRVPLAARPGRNELTIEYGVSSGPGSRTVMFRRLQILPGERVEEPSG